MDFELSAEDAAFRDEIRGWLEERRDLIDKTRKETAEYGGEKALELHRTWEKELYNGGWAGVAWPKEHGGRDASLFQQALFTEEYVRARAPERINRLGLGLIGPTLMVFGTEAQKKDHLARILSCDEIWCQSFSAPAPFPTATTSSSTARKSGPPRPATRTGSSSSCAPTPRRPSTRASPSSSST
jgi:alkylation response protein AidB-like acyl-CoA dehydrogenase